VYESNLLSLKQLMSLVGHPQNSFYWCSTTIKPTNLVTPLKQFIKIA
jgi:hypothetical protein